MGVRGKYFIGSRAPRVGKISWRDFIGKLDSRISELERLGKG